jgi:hypothetical protein
MAAAAATRRRGTAAGAAKQAPSCDAPWTKDAEDVAAELGVDLHQGLSATDVERRRAAYGFNELEKEPGGGGPAAGPARPLGAYAHMQAAPFVAACRWPRPWFRPRAARRAAAAAGGGAASRGGLVGERLADCPRPSAPFLMRPPCGT